MDKRFCFRYHEYPARADECHVVLPGDLASQDRSLRSHFCIDQRHGFDACRVRRSALLPLKAPIANRGERFTGTGRQTLAIVSGASL